MAIGANWRDDAACLHADPDLFFPEGTAGPAMDQIDEAKWICWACPVRKPCLAWALDAGIPSGIWGGTTEDERRAIGRAAGRRRHPANQRAHEQPEDRLPPLLAVAHHERDLRK